MGVFAPCKSRRRNTKWGAGRTGAPATSMSCFPAYLPQEFVKVDTTVEQLKDVVANQNLAGMPVFKFFKVSRWDEAPSLG